MWQVYFEFGPAMMGIDPENAFKPILELFTPESALMQGQQGYALYSDIETKQMDPKMAWMPDRIATSNTSGLNLASARAAQKIYDGFFFHRVKPEILEQAMSEEVAKQDTFINLETKLTKGGMCNWSDLASVQTSHPKSGQFAAAGKGLALRMGWLGWLSQFDRPQETSNFQLCLQWNFFLPYNGPSRHRNSRGIPSLCGEIVSLFFFYYY
jgi:hypothetical protein